MNRTDLALAACEGMTDEDLMKRGECGFPKMIDRKRKYAAATRLLLAENAMLKDKLAKALAQIEVQMSMIKQLEALNVQVDDTTEAQELLKGFLKGE